MKHKLALLLAMALVLATLAGCGQTSSSSNNGSQGGNGTAAATEPETLPIPCVPLAIGSNHAVGIKADGTVIFLGEDEDLQNKISGWTDIVAVSAGSSHILGLKADGTVLFAVDGEESSYDLSGWTDIVAIENSVGIKADGTVVTLNGNSIHGESLSDWTDIVATSTGSMHTVALKADGTVVSTRLVNDDYGLSDYGQTRVNSWTDITAVAAGEAHTVGLKADGTMVSTELYDEYYNRGQTKVSDWTDIIAICAGNRHTVGLKADGTVVAVGDNDNKQCNVANWTDIVAIAAGYNSTLGLKADGTVVATGFSYWALDELANWSNILLPDGSNANTEPEETAAPNKLDGLEINTDARGLVKAGVPLGSTEITVAEQAYTFPIRISELFDNGWYYRNAPTKSSTLEPKSEYGTIDYVLLHNGLPGTDSNGTPNGLSGIKIERIYNDTDQKQTDSRTCLATQIGLYGPLSSYCDFVIPGGITRNSTAADVLAVFGNPQNNASFLSGDSGTTYLAYKEHMESGLSFGFWFNEDGSIQMIEISAKEAPKPS